jgi:hypothetical protein
MALANAEEASRCARTDARDRTPDALVAVDPAELAAMLQLVSDITKQLGQALWHCGRVLYRDRGPGHSALSLAAYDVARHLHTLATPLRRGVAVGGSLNAVMALDAEVKDQQAHNRRHGPGTP